MKTKYVEDECCYLISNFGTAKSPIFLNESDCLNFRERVDKHLSPLCRILSYSFCNYEYRLIISLRSRSAFEKFYLEKHKGKKKKLVFIPESTYILSQEMANIQSGYAKQFNFRYDRKGALFARRFSKYAICSEESLYTYVNKVNNMYEVESYSWKWKVRMDSMCGFGKLKEVKDRGIMTRMVESKQRISPFQNAKQLVLQGHFKTPSILIENALPSKE